MLLVSLVLAVLQAGALAPYECGKEIQVKRPYGKVRLEVDCDDKVEYNVISILEYKGKKQHGFQIDYDSTWRKRDSSFYLNGKEEGLSLFWDTLGNVIARRSHRNGIQVGKDENYWSPGRPSIIKNYNSKGEVDGPWQKWWPNGNKRGDFVSKNDQVLSSSEYYQDGKPRLKYQGKYEKKPGTWLKQKYVNCESWAPNGKSAGKITAGNGEWSIFPDGGDTTHKTVIREVYKDSVLADVDTLTAEEIRKWSNP